MRRGDRPSLEELAPFLLPTPDPPVPLPWPAIFANEHPVEIEVGFGKGLFLLTASAACPAVNFLGIEIARKHQLFTATRLAKRQRTNVRLACIDARFFLQHCVVPASVRAVHVYFPDPWWKKRHRKRRVWTPDFAQSVEQVLRPGGRLYAVTDVAEYFTEIRATIAERTRLCPLPPADLKEPTHDLDYLTNFERKFRQQGRAIYRATYIKPEPLAES